jgi:hypothetical protein
MFVTHASYVTRIGDGDACVNAMHISLSQRLHTHRRVTSCRGRRNTYRRRMDVDMMIGTTFSDDDSRAENVIRSKSRKEHSFIVENVTIELSIHDNLIMDHCFMLVCAGMLRTILGGTDNIIRLDRDSSRNTSLSIT